MFLKCLCNMSYYGYKGSLGNRTNRICVYILREIYFKELVYVIVGLASSEMYRTGWKAGDSCQRKEWWEDDEEGKRGQKRGDRRRLASGW